MPNYAAIVTLLAVVFYFFTGIAVAKARAKFGVKALRHWQSRFRTRLPHANGHARVDAESFCRRSGCSPFTSATLARLQSAFWIFGRILYFKGYSRAAEQRGRGFAVQALAAGILIVGGLIGVIAKMVASS